MMTWHWAQGTAKSCEVETATMSAFYLVRGPLYARLRVMGNRILCVVIMKAANLSFTVRDYSFTWVMSSASQRFNGI